MVFSGKPSTACYPCRQRRLKCDRRPTGCASCMRRGLQCPGYRDPSALRLRDETDRIANKVQKSGKSSTSSSSPSSSRGGSSPHDSSTAATGSKRPSLDVAGTALASSSRDVVQDFNDVYLVVSPPTWTVLSSVSDAALSYFMVSYIIATPFEGYLPELCSPLHAAFSDDACQAALSATALATFASRAGSSKYMDAARGQYSLALRRTNAALSDPTTAILDRTLAAVLLLGVFEAVVFPGGETPTKWTTHTFGAMHLLRLRGRAQFGSRLSQQLSFHASNNIRTTCIQRAINIPDDFAPTNELAEKLMGPQHPNLRLVPIIEKLARIKAGYLGPTCSPQLLADTVALDWEIRNLLNDIFGSSSETLKKELNDYAVVECRFLHDYSAVRIARITNAVQLTRMWVIHIIHECSSGVMPLDITEQDLVPENDNGATTWETYLASLLEYALEQRTVLSSQILASVPKFRETASLGGGGGGGGGGSGGHKYALAARSLVWPLSVLEKSDLYPPEHRAQAVQHLKEISEDLNLPLALHPVKRPGYRNDWLHLMHLC